MGIDLNIIEAMSLSKPPSPERPAPPPAAARAGAPCPPRWSSQALLGDRAEVQIVHGDQVYRLRRTALGKLILTK